MTKPGPRTVLAVALVGLVACKEDEIRTPTRYLERPNAMDFFCVGPVDQVTPGLTALPAYACDEQVEGSDRRALFALVTNSGRSEVAMVNVTRGQLVDLVDANPGYGFVPVGEAPVGVQVTEDGCSAYVTNHGTCNLTQVNLNAVLHVAGLELMEGAIHGSPTGRIGIRAASGRLLSRPHSLVLHRRQSEELPPIQACGPISGHRAFVSLPSCGLVASVDLASGRILQSLRLTDSGLVAAGIDPQCPADCVDHVGDGVSGGELATHRPGPLLQTWDGYRLVIGWTSAPRISIVDVDPVTGELANARTLELVGEERGVHRIRETLTLTSDWHFLYVITRSGAVHVLDGDWEEECELNPDPTDPFFPVDPMDDAQWDSWSSRRGCLRLSDPTTPERAPGVRSPALLLPGSRKAVDVGFVELEAEGFAGTSLTSLDPRFLVGTFAYVLSQDGLTYLANVDEDLAVDADPGTSDTPLVHRRGDGVHAVLSHQLRNASNTLPDSSGRARPSDGVEQGIFQSGEPLQDDGTRDRLVKRPGGNEPLVDVLDPYRARSESWSLRFEGLIPGASRVSGQVVRRDLGAAPDGLAELRDPGLPFCHYGVRDGDVLVLVGCQREKDCGEGFYCFRTFLQPAGAAGICLAQDVAPNLEPHCETLALSRREYVISRAEADRLLVEPRWLEGVSVCAGADLGRYCCDTFGDVVGVTDPVHGCVAGPLPDLGREVVTRNETLRMAHCFEGFVRYEIRVAPESYLLSGTTTGTPLRGIPDDAQGGRCIANPEDGPFVTARVPRSEDPFRNQALGFTLEVADGPTANRPSYGFSLHFDLVGGFIPQAVDVSARLPAMMMLAPDGFLYVVDQGDDSSLGGLMGQVLRLLPGDIALDTSFIVR